MEVPVSLRHKKGRSECVKNELVKMPTKPRAQRISAPSDHPSPIVQNEEGRAALDLHSPGVNHPSREKYLSMRARRYLAHQPLSPLPEPITGSAACPPHDGTLSKEVTQKNTLPSFDEVYTAFIQDKYQELQKNMGVSSESGKVVEHPTNSSSLGVVAAHERSEAIEGRGSPFTHVLRSACSQHSPAALLRKSDEEDLKRVRELQIERHYQDIIENHGREVVDPNRKSSAALASSTRQWRKPAGDLTAQLTEGMKTERNQSPSGLSFDVQHRSCSRFAVSDKPRRQSVEVLLAEGVSSDSDDEERSPVRKNRGLECDPLKKEDDEAERKKMNEKSEGVKVDASAASRLRAPNEEALFEQASNPTSIPEEPVQGRGRIKLGQPLSTHSHLRESSQCCFCCPCHKQGPAATNAANSSRRGSSSTYHPIPRHRAPRVRSVENPTTEESGSEERMIDVIVEELEPLLEGCSVPASDRRLSNDVEERAAAESTGKAFLDIFLGDEDDVVLSVRNFRQTKLTSQS